MQGFSSFFFLFLPFSPWLTDLEVFSYVLIVEERQLLHSVWTSAGLRSLIIQDTDVMCSLLNIKHESSTDFFNIRLYVSVVLRKSAFKCEQINWCHLFPVDKLVCHAYSICTKGDQAIQAAKREGLFMCKYLALLLFFSNEMQPIPFQFYTRPSRSFTIYHSFTYSVTTL